MYAKKNKPMYGKGGMAKLAQYMSGGRIYAENGDRVPEASADPLKSPAVQASIEKLLSPYRDQIDYIRQQRSKYGSNDPAVRNFNIRPAYAALEGAGEGDVDLLRSLISMDPTNREEAAQKSKAIEFAQSVSDEYAREMGTPVRNPLYNFFGLEGGPKYNNGGTVKYRSGGVMKYENGGSHEIEPDLTFITKQDPDLEGGGITQFLVDGRPVTTEEAIDYYASNMGPRESFNEWFNNTSLNSSRRKAQETDVIKSQINKPGNRLGQTFSGGQARAQRSSSGDTRQQQGGNEGIEGKSREDRMRKLLSGLADYNQ